MYLPGIIFFTKMALSDKFMFVGHCQPSDGSWHNRNYIRNARLTVPIKHGAASINETKFADDHWPKKHLRSIELQYSKRPFFKDYFGGLSNLISLRGHYGWRNLADLNCALISLVMDYLHIRTPVLRSQHFGITGHKTDMLIDMCRKTGADEYLSSPGETYVDQEKMAAAGIKHHFLKFTHPIYDQGHPEFITNLSIIDLLFNCGPESGRIVREAGSIA